MNFMIAHISRIKINGAESCERDMDQQKGS